MQHEEEFSPGWALSLCCKKIWKSPVPYATVVLDTVGTRYPDRELRQRIQNAAQGRVQSTLSSYLVLQKNLKVSSTLNANGLRYSAYTRYPDRVQRPSFKDRWRSPRSGYRVCPLSSILCHSGVGPCRHTIPWSSAATKFQRSLAQGLIRVSCVSTLQYFMPEWYRTLWTHDTLIECSDKVSKIVGAALDQGIVCIHSPVSYASVV